MSLERNSSEITEKMGLRKLPSSSWAKSEILLGGFAMACGGLYGVYHTARMVVRDESRMLEAGTGVLLFTLGSYLFSAGNRSMLYRSQNHQTQYLESLLEKKN